MSKIKIFLLLPLFIVSCSNCLGTSVETDFEIQTEYDISEKSNGDIMADDGNLNESSIFTDKSGNEFSVSIISVSSTDLSYVIKNHSQNEVNFGTYGDLYIKKDTTWELVDYRELEENEFFMKNAVLCHLCQNQEIEQYVSFETYYDELDSGHYKLSLGEFYYDKDDLIVAEIEFDIE